MTDQELIEQFLKNGGEVQKLETIDPQQKVNVGSISKKTQQLMTLSEGEELFGEKKPEREVKEKEVDYSGINIDLIPEHLRKFMVVKPKDT
jgi:hypothetical protein